MKRLLIAAGLLVCGTLASHAQNASSLPVFTTCGTATYANGNLGYMTLNTSGQLCIAGTISASTSATASSTLPTISAGAGAAVYESLGGALYSQLVFATASGGGTQVDATHGLPVDVKTSVLPTGAATSANQTSSLSPVAPASPTATFAQLGACEYVSAGVTFTNLQQGSIQCDSAGRILATLASAGPVAPGTAATKSNLSGGVYNATPPTLTDTQQAADQMDVAGNLKVNAAVTPVTTNPTSTLALPSTTTAYTAGWLMCTSATVATCNTALSSQYLTIANAAGGVIVPRLRLGINDATSTAWGGQTITIDLWSAAPTFQTTGDRAAFVTDLLTGTAGHLAAFACTMSANASNSDGAYGECTPNYGNFALIKLASGTSVFWTATATSGSGVTGASKTVTLTAELLN